MTDPRLQDHVVGLELQLVELVERRERALVQGLTDDAETIAREIDEVQTELIVSAEALAAEKPTPHAEVRAESAEDATFSLVDAGMHVGAPRPRVASGGRPRRARLAT
jgi:hypothetical protein